MPAHRSPRWTPSDLAVLRQHYPSEGAEGVAKRLVGRSWRSIYLKAHRLGLTSERSTHAPEHRLLGADLEEAIQLREEQGWSFARIGEKYGVAEASACNAVLAGLCPRKGYTPAQRDEYGRLTAEGIERLRLALRKGLKGVDIQLRLGVSASRVAEERRRYNRELKARGKALLPPPGGGVAYSGVKLTRAKKTEAETLFLQGLGTAKVSERTGVSKTSCTRIRNRLIRRLKRQGQTLPGCDERGVRHAQAESSRFIPSEIKEALRSLLLDRVPVRRAAILVAVGICSAYRIRDQFAAELKAKGHELPAPILPGRRQVNIASAHWPPEGARAIYAFRELMQGRSFDEAKAEWCRRKREERQAEAMRPRSFEEQLERIGCGEIGIAPALARRHLETTVLRAEEGRAAA